MRVISRCCSPGSFVQVRPQAISCLNGAGAGGYGITGGRCRRRDMTLNRVRPALPARPATRVACCSEVSAADEPSVPSGDGAFVGGVEFRRRRCLQVEGLPPSTMTRVVTGLSGDPFLAACSSCLPSNPIWSAPACLFPTDLRSP